MKKMMSELQFLRISEKVAKRQEHSFKERLTKIINNRYDISYTAWDAFSIVKVNILSVCPFFKKNKVKKYLSKSQQFYKNGYEKLEKDFELIGLMKTINKMKATIAVLVEKNKN